VVARLSGDEFGLIIDGRQPEAGKALAGQLAVALADEFQIDASRCAPASPPASRYFRINGSDAASLLANAAPRCSAPSKNRRGSISVFEPEMDQQIRDRRVAAPGSFACDQETANCRCITKPQATSATRLPRARSQAS